MIGGVIQIGLYGATVFWLASQFREAAAAAVVIGLLLNPVLVAVVADMLTEAPTLILTVLMMGCLVKISRSPRPLVWATAGALATNFALMIRPSNIMLIIAWNAALPFAFRTARTLVPYAGIWVATAAITWAPQIAHNISLGHYGVLPAFPLFSGQLKWGVFIARYASIVHDNAAFSYVLLNPWRASTLEIEPVRWYLEHPVDGLATIIVHVLSAFTFDRLSTYLYDCRPNFLLAGVMWAVIALGALHGARLLYQKFRQPEAIALAILFFSSVGLIAITAPENRFAAIPLTILSVLAAHFLVTFQKKSRWFLAVAAVAGVLGWQFAHTLNAYQPSENYTKFGCPQ